MSSLAYFSLSYLSQGGVHTVKFAVWCCKIQLQGPELGVAILSFEGF